MHPNLVQLQVRPNRTLHRHVPPSQRGGAVEPHLRVPGRRAERVAQLVEVQVPGLPARGERRVPDLDLGRAEPVLDSLALQQLDEGDVPDLLAEVDVEPVAPVPEGAEALVVADDTVDGLVGGVDEVVRGADCGPHGAVVPVLRERRRIDDLVRMIVTIA